MQQRLESRTKAASGSAALLRPTGQDVLRLWPISPRVNAVQNNNASLIEPVGA